MDEADEIDFASGIQSFESKHFARAMQLLSPLAIKGNADAQHRPKAVEWFTKAAEQGLAGSQTTLAMLYEQGTLIEKDEDKASEWYKKAGF